jgi:ABC-type transport system involved in cytochrome bd biosynthesis fused ATPase/permease subunit
MAGFDHFAMLLALMPGGLGEMTLIALALGIDVPFVVTHHMVRIALVMLIAPLVFRWVRKRDAKRAAKEIIASRGKFTMTRKEIIEMRDEGRRK